VESGLSPQIKRALLQQVIAQYRQATTVKKKSKLLDAFTASTGYNRKYAMWLLDHAQVVPALLQLTLELDWTPLLCVQCIPY
jgi:hypothetical protein